ncbi:hypothetical protein [Blastochloris viridis]|uniref:Uncharacterized protein n=1 Tax=Blastochloris viridis TaxID=1079 RepID=A0A0H5BC17_BLAVI|nr:hypothetical protein [Blastochloris viridis]ALK08882.1 hypothetical protein BVIR_1093 [Blastochloris viridis]BAR97816.1 hypothetical protein BV133_223 [Blastochloris viridis]CUU41543.1 hypothetical protein BVIRIDIS_05360 [Blastochloris viridis]
MLKLVCQSAASLALAFVLIQSPAQAASAPHEMLLAQRGPDRDADSRRGPDNRRDFDNRRGPDSRAHRPDPVRSFNRERRPPPGWRRYHERPRDWNRRGCTAIGPIWYCP